MTTQITPVPSQRPRRTAAAAPWFAAMLGASLVFFAVLAIDESSLGDLWQSIRDLPVLVEALVWLALFPFVLGLGAWDSGLAKWARVVLVVCFALGWSAALLPRRKPRR